MKTESGAARLLRVPEGHGTSEDWLQLAELLAGHRLDPTGARVLLMVGPSCMFW